MADLLDLPLGRSSIDRDYLTRNRPNLFDELSIDQSARVLVMNNGKVLLQTSEHGLVPQLQREQLLFLFHLISEHQEL